MSSTAEKIRERRLDRMRLGQDVADVVILPSDHEVKLHIVPLTEAEYLQALEAVASIRPTGTDDLAGFQLRERRQSQEIIVRAVREPMDLTKRVWTDVDEMMSVLDIVDVDEIIDAYNQMVERSSPSMEGLTTEDFNELKKVLQEMNWNELSGRAWYAAKRFLSEITMQLLQVNSPGSGSTNSSTKTSESEKSTPTA